MNLFKQCIVTICVVALTFLNQTTTLAEGTQIIPCGQSTPPVESVNQFTVDLYRQLTTQDQGNILFSPYSIVSALAMTYIGAKGETKAQIAHALHFPLCTTSENEFHQVFSELNRSLTAKRSNLYQLNVANALWGEQQFPVVESFNNTLKKFYEAQLQSVDFQSNPEEARLIINQWVEVETANRIKELLSKGAVDSSTQLVLTNALYFKGSWAVPFKEKDTKPLPFTISPGSPPIHIPMMELVGTFDYSENSMLQAIELPYTYQSNLSMVILLPKSGVGLSAINLQEQLSHLKTKFSQAVVEVWLPKFRVESTFELKESLQALQITAAFTPGEADFSGITDQGKFALSAVIHKTFVDVNEKGTEAAAATAVMTAKGIQTSPEPSAIFHADRPFIFLIRERNSGVILFAGRVVNPNS